YQQCSVIELPRSSYYFKPKGESLYNQRVMKAIDRKFLDCPFYGVERMKERRDYMFTLVRQWRESGLTRQEFCLQHGITVGKFGYWISRWKEDQSGGDNGF